MLLSVDPPETSAEWAAKKGFSAFTILSDPEMRVIDAWDLHNEKEDIAFHAAYLIDADKTIVYRKAARRRPKSAELLSALRGEPIECCASLCDEEQPVCRSRP